MNFDIGLNKKNNQNGKEIVNFKLKKNLKKIASTENLAIQNLRLSSSIIDLMKKDSEKLNYKKTFERTRMLYLNGLENKKNVIINKLRYDEIKIVNELEKCTFRPDIKSASKLKQYNEKGVINSAIYERQFLWQQKKTERYLTFFKNRNEKGKKISKIEEISNCSFKPSIMYNIPSFPYKYKFDNKTIKYIVRITKAREDKYSLQDKLNKGASI